jgi:hypothetical protein
MSRTRTPRQWREILDAYDRSELSQAEFCRRRGLAVATFRYRRARAAAEARADVPQLVELFTGAASPAPGVLRLELDLAVGPASIEGHAGLIAELLSLLAPSRP